MKVSALGIEEQRVNVLIDLTEPRERWERLGHGYRVEPRIVLWESAIRATALPIVRGLCSAPERQSARGQIRPAGSMAN
jgi:hypothetical protein